MLKEKKHTGLIRNYETSTIEVPCPKDPGISLTILF